MNDMLTPAPTDHDPIRRAHTLSSQTSFLVAEVYEDGVVLSIVYTAVFTSLCIIKVRVERILASRWSEDETRERLVHGGNASFLYVAVRTPCDDGELNDPSLFDNHCYVLWLMPHAVPDAQFEIIQSYAQEPILRSAVYKACIGHKGALLLDERDGSAMHALVLSGIISEDECAQRTRKIAESQREYLLNSFNTTNKHDIVQAVRHLVRAMAPGSDKRAHLQRAMCGRGQALTYNIFQLLDRVALCAFFRGHTMNHGYTDAAR